MASRATRRRGAGRSLRGSWGFPRATLALLAWYLGVWPPRIAIAKRAPPASAGEGGREPASGAPAHDVLRPDGGDAVPPESKPAAERPPANLDRRQNCHAARTAAGRPDANLSRRQSRQPRISTGGRAAPRESRPAAER